MALIGGYHIVNLKFAPLTIELPKFENGKNKQGNVSAGLFYEDIWYNLVNSHAKRVVLSGLNLNGVRYADYEVLFYSTSVDDTNCYQCILRKEWNTSSKFVTTFYLNIFDDDSIGLSYDMLCYETDPDKSFSTTSTNALQNKVISTKFNEVDETLSDHDTRITKNTNDIEEHYSEFTEFKEETTAEQLTQNTAIEELNDKVETLYPIDTELSLVSTKPVTNSAVTERISDISTDIAYMKATTAATGPIGVISIPNSGNEIVGPNASVVWSASNDFSISTEIPGSLIVSTSNDFYYSTITIDLETIIKYMNAQGILTTQLENINKYKKVTGTISLVYNEYYDVVTERVIGSINNGRIYVTTLPYTLAVHDSSLSPSAIGTQLYLRCDLSCF